MALFDISFDVRVVSSVLLLSILFYVLIGTTINYRKLRHIQGPPLAAILRSWLFWQEFNARTNKAQYVAIKKYGSPARIGPDLLVTDDPDLVRHMNALNSPWRRSGWHEGLKLDPRLETVFSTREEKLHAELKAKKYNGRDIDTLEPDIDSQVIGLLDLIKTTYAGKPMDVSVVIRFFTLDVLSIVAFGRPFGFMAKNKDLWDHNNETSQFLLALLLVANHKSIRTVFFALFPFIGSKETDKTGIGPVIAFARKAMRERFGPNAKLQCEAEVATCDDAMQRREDNFGNDSHLFGPDRWIEADEVTSAKFRRTTDYSFGSGRFICLGWHIAFMELHKALIELMRDFDWQMADPMRGIDTHAHGVHVQSQMNLFAWPRSKG